MLTGAVVMPTLSSLVSPTTLPPPPPPQPESTSMAAAANAVIRYGLRIFILINTPLWWCCGLVERSCGDALLSNNRQDDATGGQWSVVDGLVGDDRLCGVVDCGPGVGVGVPARKTARRDIDPDAVAGPERDGGRQEVDLVLICA